MLNCQNVTDNHSCPLLFTTVTTVLAEGREKALVAEPMAPISRSLALNIPHVTISDCGIINLRKGRVFARYGLGARDIGWFGKGEDISHPASYIRFPNGLPLLSAGKVALFPGHDLPGVDNVEEHEGDEHQCRVKDVLVCFMNWDAAGVASRVFDHAEDNADLMQCKSFTVENQYGKIDAYSDKGQNGIENVEQAERSILVCWGSISLHLMLEADC